MTSAATPVNATSARARPTSRNETLTRATQRPGDCNLRNTRLFRFGYLLQPIVDDLPQYQLWLAKRHAPFDDETVPLLSASRNSAMASKPMR